MRKLLAAIAVGGVVLFIPGVAGATPSPNGPGQPGAPNTTCGSPNAQSTPGGSANAKGSPFNADGVSGQHYAGNPGTASTLHATSPHAVSQYDIACFQASN
jgi:hypothetical protein